MRFKPMLIMGLTIGSMTLSEACGPDFSVVLTQCRARCLDQIKAPGLFADAALMAAGAPPGPPAHEETDETAKQILDLESTEPTEVRQIISNMRAQASGTSAYEIGATLPEVYRAYTAGAVEFNHLYTPVVRSPYAEEPRFEDYPESDSDEEANEEAQRAAAQATKDAADARAAGFRVAMSWFSKVTALPKEKAAPRLLMAWYMLGRCHQVLGEVDAAEAAFTQVVTLATGTRPLPDPLGLANAALGQMGKIEYLREDYAKSITYYAQQAQAPGAQTAYNSLYFLARRLDSKLKTQPNALELIVEPQIQRLLIITLLEDTDGTCFLETCQSYEFRTNEAGAEYYVAKNPPPPKELATFFALKQLPLEQIQLPDRVAGIAYALGEFEYADKLIRTVHTPYAEWIHAKLALHAGDTVAAGKYIATAAKAFPVTAPTDVAPTAQTQSSGEEAESYTELRRREWVSRLRAENALLLLQRKDFTEALYQLTVARRYADDAAYVAERVLTIDELKALVDKQGWAKPYGDLLARRLMRAGRGKEALGYYTDIASRAAAEQYQHWLEVASSDVPNNDKAQALYRAANLAVLSGMEIMGTDRCPDFAALGGSYERSCDSEPGDASLISAEEKQRADASAPQPNSRFHYRGKAAAHLLAAADLLPRRTHILSAILCNGAHWLRHRRSESDVAQLYKRYVRDGRAEPWASNFGETCPEPDFSKVE